MNNHPRIEIMDTTLRDGEQTSGVSFVPHEKLMIARLLLEDLKVDRIEVASARVSEGEAKAVNDLRLGSSSGDVISGRSVGVCRRKDFCRLDLQCGMPGDQSADERIGKAL